MKNLCALLLVLICGRAAIGCSSGETDTAWTESPDAGAEEDAGKEQPPPEEVKEAGL